jgi:hypothetical protein
MTPTRDLTPYPPMALGPAARAGLMALRIFLAVMTAMAVYAFLRGLPQG